MQTTIFSIPRRRMLIRNWAALASALPAMRDVGVINSAEIVFNRETNEYRAVDVSTGACREYVADSNSTAPDGTLTIELMSNVAANLAMVMSSSVMVNASGTATQETCETLAVGDVVTPKYLPDPDTIVVTDSDAGPTTLVLGTDYAFYAKKVGSIMMLNVDTFTQPFNLEYTTINSKSIAPMSDLNKYFYVELVGGNERNSCGGEKEIIYRVSISDAQTKRLSEAADVKIAQPMIATFLVDRDHTRNFEFAEMALDEAA